MDALGNRIGSGVDLRKVSKEARATRPGAESQRAVKRGARFLKVLLVADHGGTGQWLHRALQLEPQFKLCATLSHLSAAPPMIRLKKPHLVVIELPTRSVAQAEFIRALARDFSELPLLVVASQTERFAAERFFKAGARGFILQSESPEELCWAMNALLQGERYLSRRIGALMFLEYIRNHACFPAADLTRLTGRELEVFDRVGAGLDVRQIADQLQLKRRTVETHREHIKHKLGLIDLTALRRYAVSCHQREGRGSPPTPSQPSQPFP